MKVPYVYFHVVSLFPHVAVADRAGDSPSVAKAVRPWLKAPEAIGTDTFLEELDGSESQI